MHPSYRSENVWTLCAKQSLTSLGHPSPTFCLNFWGGLYNCLLSLLCEHHTMNKKCLH